MVRAGGRARTAAWSTPKARPSARQRRANISSARTCRRACTFEVGDALETIKKYPGPFDIVFIDVDKQGYPQALELARSRVRAGGLILTDNVLWSGRVLDASSGDASTRGVQRYDAEVFSAPDLFTTIIPLRDGVAVSLKLGAHDHKDDGRRKIK